jgi:hypothetical protein
VKELRAESFKAVPGLVSLDAKENKIVKIEREIFDVLVNLEVLLLNNNVCIKEDFLQDVQTIALKRLEKCFNGEKNSAWTLKLDCFVILILLMLSIFKSF